MQKLLNYIDIATLYYAATSDIKIEIVEILVYTAHHNSCLICNDAEIIKIQKEIRQAMLN